MEPADILKINMTVKEARAIQSQYPELDRRRRIMIGFGPDVRKLEMTPAQAQAALVLAWNDLLTRADASWLEAKPQTDEL